jgi:hypothetical protein
MFSSGFLTKVTPPYVYKNIVHRKGYTTKTTRTVNGRDNFTGISPQGMKRGDGGVFIVIKHRERRVI